METVYYTISDDDGDTWSDRIALTENSGKVGETDLAVTSQGDIWVVYNSCQEFCGIHYRTSADNGDSWSPETLLEADVYSPSIASSGQELMIAFSRQDCSPITCDSDIWYKVATPEDIPQSPSVQYTTYQGRDYLPSVATLADGNFAIAWSSDRRFADGLWTTPYTIWFGIPGVREDISPPPVISRFNHAPLPNPDADDEVFITANIDDDEPGVSATVLWNKDGVQQADVPMADNGSSGDAQSGDGVFTASLGVMPAGTSGTYHVRVEDSDGNLLETSEQSFQVIPEWVQQNRILLVVDDVSSRGRDESAPFYRAALDALAFGYDFWDTSLRGTPDLDELALYQDGAVIWSIPSYDSYLWYDRSPAGISALESYLDNGGRLFISGAELFILGETAPSFYRDYLHVDYADCCVSVWDLGGIPGDVIGDGLSFRIQGGDGANNQKSHHVITPLSPAAQVFSYVDLSQVSQAFPPQQGPAFLPLFPEGLLRDDAGLYPAFPQNQHAASPLLAQKLDHEPLAREREPDSSTLSHIRSGTAALRVDTGAYRMVYFGFGFEAIDSFQMRQDVMARVLNWLGEETGPFLISPSDWAAVPTGDVTFQWRAVADANDYRIQIDTVDTFDSPGLIDAIVADTQYTLNLATLGKRYWRVLARDIDLNESPWSAVRRLFINEGRDIVQVTPEGENYNYYPPLVQLSGDSLMVFYSECCWNLYSKTSNDGGDTWSAPTFILQDVWDPDAVHDSTGVTWLVYHRYPESSESYDIFYRTSSEDGQTWSEEQPVAVSPLREREPSIVRTASSRLIVTSLHKSVLEAIVADRLDKSLAKIP